MEKYVNWRHLAQDPELEVDTYKKYRDKINFRYLSKALVNRM